MTRILAAIIAITAVLGGAAYLMFRGLSGPTEPVSKQTMAERVEFKTSDNVSIVGDYYAPTSLSAKGLLLLHMMPADRTSLRQFAEKMQSAGWPGSRENLSLPGWHVLAVDLRGHGESQGGPNGYKSFSDAEHQASRHDAEAGAEFLRSKGATELSLGGASIGANLALQYLAEHPDAKAAFLLSPGLDYRGVTTESAARSLRPGQVVFYVASRDDAYSTDTIQKLFDVTPAGVEKSIQFFETAGHGTTIFEKEPAFMDTIASWLQKVAKP